MHVPRGTLAWLRIWLWSQLLAFGPGFTIVDLNEVNYMASPLVPGCCRSYGGREG